MRAFTVFPFTGREMAYTCLQRESDPPLATEFMHGGVERHFNTDSCTSIRSESGSARVFRDTVYGDLQYILA